MGTARYVHWQEGGCGSATNEAFSDYLMQGESPLDLEENLRDLYRDLTSGEIADIRKVVARALT